MELVVCEGGPTLMGTLVDAGFIDELFLTVAPQVAGRSPETPRLAMIEGVGFAVGDTPWARLISVMRSDDHLFVRYRLDGSAPGEPGAGGG
jgi:riboflavin biosynthesis pyrimidine reductase